MRRPTAERFPAQARFSAVKRTASAPQPNHAIKRSCCTPSRQNNLSETAFVVPEGGGSYHLRWFTPTVEVNCCGHATLATGALILDRLTPEAASVTFTSRSGVLKVRRAAGDASLLSLDFPLWPAAEHPCAPPAALAEAMGGAPPAECYSIPEMVRCCLPRGDASSRSLSLHTTAAATSTRS